jgi:hypothetical protein
MTKHEAAVISLVTGTLCCDFGDMQAYAEKIMERPLWTHNFGDKELVETMQEKARPDFLEIVENLQED